MRQRAAEAAALAILEGLGVQGKGGTGKFCAVLNERCVRLLHQRCQA